MEKLIEVGGIGPVTFIMRNTCRNMRITVKHNNTVKVTMPYGYSINSAMQFVDEKKGWIKKQQNKNELKATAPVLFDESTVFRTTRHALRILKHEKNTIKSVIDKDFISVYYPYTADIKDPRIQEAVKKAILMAWRMEAEEILPFMTSKLAMQHGLKYSSLKIRNNKTRWGSCSGKNSINLNFHLVRLPHHLCEYVILHELAHTIHKNHGEYFWRTLDKMTGNARGLDKELNLYCISVW